LDRARRVREPVGRAGVRLRNPSHGFPYSNLAFAYRGLGRFEEARKTAESAVALRIETLPTRRLLFQLAVLAGDEEAAARQVDWARDKSREFDMAGARAQAAGFAGRVREARLLYEETARMAERANLPDVATAHLMLEASMELAYGNVDRAAQQTRRVLDRGGGGHRRRARPGRARVYVHRIRPRAHGPGPGWS
jgi:tetratricopeptide (TPR) repeat protein